MYIFLLFSWQDYLCVRCGNGWKNEDWLSEVLKKKMYIFLLFLWQNYFVCSLWERIEERKECRTSGRKEEKEEKEKEEAYRVGLCMYLFILPNFLSGEITLLLVPGSDLPLVLIFAFLLLFFVTLVALFR